MLAMLASRAFDVLLLIFRKRPGAAGETMRVLGSRFHDGDLGYQLLSLGVSTT
jgi:hypothetical protein